MKKNKFWLRNADFIFLSIIFLFFISCTSVDDNKKDNNVFDYPALIKKDSLWNIVENDSTGLLKLRKDYWLMHFLHWRPIENPDTPLSIEGVKKTVQTLWGPQMAIKLTGDCGETTVNGHPAYYADATFGDNIVQTRMIIWNCPETNRQFISDCNINLKRNTPQEFFKIETDEITGSIDCHGDIQNNNKSTSHCTKKFVSDSAKVSFYTPENWRTSEFRFPTDKTPEYITPGYYPNGINEKEGSLWTLATESEKEILIKWQDNSDDREISRNWLREYITALGNDTTTEMMNSKKIIYKMTNFTFDEFQTDKDMITCSGSYDYGYESKELQLSDSDPYLYKAFLFKKDSNIYFLFCSMVNYKNIWGVDVDLSPSDESFDHFINDEVLGHLH